MLSFSPAVDYPVGVNPMHIVSGDFNSDGRLDLATDNASLSVLLGNADGTFQAALTTGPAGCSLAVGDFNDDGKLDLATAGGVRLGNGNGTFQAPTSLGIEFDSIPHSVAVGDFNADGKLDLGGDVERLLPRLPGLLRLALRALRRPRQRAAGKGRRLVLGAAHDLARLHGSSAHGRGGPQRRRPPRLRDDQFRITLSCCWARALAPWGPRATSAPCTMPRRCPRETSTATATSTW